MADEETTAVIEAPEIDAPVEEVEPRSFTEDDLRGMSLDEFLRLRPDVDEHLDSRASELTQREMERLLPTKVAEVREMVQQEAEDAYLERLRTNIVDQQSRLAYYDAKEKVAQEREARGQKALERSEVERARLSRRVEREVTTLANKVWNVSPEAAKAVDALAKRHWAPGDEGIEEYVEALTDIYAEHKVSGREKLIAETTKKDVLSEVQPEGPDVGNTAGGGGRRKETYTWFQSLSLPERQAIRQDAARYERILQTA